VNEQKLYFKTHFQQPTNRIMQLLKTDVSEHKPDKQLSLMPNKPSHPQQSCAERPKVHSAALFTTA